MISARKTNLRRKRAGFSLLELTVSMVIALLVIVSFNQIFEIALLLLKRARTQEIVATQIDPLKDIFTHRVRACRAVLFDSLANAKANNPAGIIRWAHTSATPAFVSNGSPLNDGMALRCTYRVKQGVFIIYWDAAPPGGADPGIYLITGKANGNNPGDLYNNAIPLTNALSYLNIDTNGPVDVSVGIPSPFQNIYSRNVGGLIPYNFVQELDINLP